MVSLDSHSKLKIQHCKTKGHVKKMTRIKTQLATGVKNQNEPFKMKKRGQGEAQIHVNEISRLRLASGMIRSLVLKRCHQSPFLDLTAQLSPVLSSEFPPEAARWSPRTSGLHTFQRLSNPVGKEMRIHLTVSMKIQSSNWPEFETMPFSDWYSQVSSTQSQRMDLTPP